jgi:predicted esterase
VRAHTPDVCAPARSNLGCGVCLLAHASDVPLRTDRSGARAHLRDMRHRTIIVTIAALAAAAVAHSAHATTRHVDRHHLVPATQHQVVTPTPARRVAPVAVRSRVRRYRDKTFKGVTVTHDVVYGQAVDHAGINDTLRLDIYQPAHDSRARRAAILWLHPGGFTTGDKSIEAVYANDFGRRGYVSVAIDYRLRPKMQWFDFNERPYAARDAYDDATSALVWIAHHAEEYRIDPRLIFAAGYSAGAITAQELASPPDGSETNVAGVMSIAGYGMFPARPGQPPRLLFHGTHDWLVPYALDIRSCAQAKLVRDDCDLVTFTNGEHDIGYVKVAPIADETARFFSAIIARRS